MEGEKRDPSGYEEMNANGTWSPRELAGQLWGAGDSQVEDPDWNPLSFTEIQ
jgi:hypothetical protein